MDQHQGIDVDVGHAGLWLCPAGDLANGIAAGKPGSEVELSNPCIGQERGRTPKELPVGRAPWTTQGATRATWSPAVRSAAKWSLPPVQ